MPQSANRRGWLPIDHRAEVDGVGRQIESFRREIDAATVCIVELRRALCCLDSGRIAAAGLSLYRAWGRARTALTALKSAPPHVEAIAHEALLFSQDFAYDLLERALAPILGNTPPSTDDVCEA
jgi:aryl-alcohol dehydrogenase-like predicted oxidoreductase